MDATLGPELTPWEQRQQLGALRGFLQTLKGVAFSPRTFFDRLRPETAWTDAFWYGWLEQALFGGIGVLLAALAFWPPDLRDPLDAGWYVTALLGPVVLYPVLVLVLAAVVHGLLLISRGAHHGLAATLRAICYSGVALGALVVAPGPVWIWTLTIGVYALARLQQMRVARAALALVGAELLLAGVVIAAGWMILAPRLR